MALNDRSYMHSSAPRNEMNGKKMLWILIIINIVVFIFPPNHGSFLALTMLNGKLPISGLLNIVTAGFVHSNFSHILFNMWGLWIFGGMISPHLNGKKMLILYLSGVICGNLLFVLFNLNTLGEITLLGASGAVCAFMAAAATLEPEQRLVMIFMPFTPIKTPTLVLCYTAMEVIFELFGRKNGVAHLAHLGGFISGYIAMRICFGRALPWDPFRAILKKSVKTSAKPKKENSSSAPHVDDNSRVSQKELDDLLDKLSNYGINSFSPHEVERLKKARRQMRGEE